MSDEQSRRFAALLLLPDAGICCEVPAGAGGRLSQRYHGSNTATVQMEGHWVEGHRVVFEVLEAPALRAHAYRRRTFLSTSSR
jgi:hypothetical protein